MSFKLSFVLLLVFGTLLLVPDTSAGVVGRKRRQEIDDRQPRQDVSEVLSHRDRKRIENAVRAEIRDNQGQNLTPQQLDLLVEEHSQEQPWYKRLFKRFKESLPQIIEAIATRVLQDFVVPAISKQLNAG